MSSHPSLRKRLVIGMVCFTTIITAATSLIGLCFDEQAEQRVWEAMLKSAFAHQIAASHDHRRAEAQPLLAYGTRAGKPLPAEFLGLGQGIHDDVQVDDRVYVIDVEGSKSDPFVLALDITDMERRESTLDLDMLGSAAVVVFLLITLTYFAARWLVKPLANLSGAIRNLQPNTRGQQIEIRSSDPSEIALIANAFNAYLRDIDGHVARERKFLNMASHELRTPLAVISGAAEIANEQPNLELARLHVSRIIDTSRAMHDLVELLLALARDPERLRAEIVPVSLVDLIPQIVADHQHLLEGKGLSIAYGDMSATKQLLPRSIAQSVIGNLVRNAIENGSHGAISISVEKDGTLVITGPRSMMSPMERSELQARLVRAGVGRRDGIGLELVERLCHHAKWQLDLQVDDAGGTTARLGFRNSA